MLRTNGAWKRVSDSRSTAAPSSRSTARHRRTCDLKVRLRSPQLTSRLSSPRGGGRSPHRRRVVMPKLMISVLVSALSALAGAGVERFLIGRVLRFRGLSWSALRSEEHTSELQSPYDLGCRL